MRKLSYARISQVYNQRTVKQENFYILMYQRLSPRFEYLCSNLIGGVYEGR